MTRGLEGDWEDYADAVGKDLDEYAADMPRYSGARPECVKCGYGGPDVRAGMEGRRPLTDTATTEFMATGECHHPDHVEDTYERVSNPRMHRACRRCGYQWDEAPVDAE